MRLPTIKDTSQRESTTLMFVTIAFITMNFGYLWNITHGTAATLTEYGSAVALILAPWLGREWIKKE